MTNDGGHGLADRVERVHLVEFVLRARSANTLVVLTEVQHEAKQCTLGLVADLFRQLILGLGRLQTHHTN